MRKIVLTLLIGFLFSNQLSAQSCSPNSLYQDSTFGIWPDTAQDLPPAAANVFYSTDINFICPDNVTAELDPSGQFVGNPIDEFKVTSIDGFPTGIDYACNNSSCEYDGGELGCANIYGTPTATGTYPLTINVDVVVLVTIFGVTTPVTQAESFGGYELVVGNAGTIESIINPISVYPNPSNDNISIKGLTKNMNASKIEIVNLSGKTEFTSPISSEENEISIRDLQSGVYFVKIHHAKGIKTLRFIRK
ncbi:MAG: T9SS type A sorting domain-containing protein [Crocinitomicaceae bacterium]|nr:T9SS type A sorting domain-containing protein [Crocinitomicaceae bacterium]